MKEEQKIGVFLYYRGGLACLCEVSFFVAVLLFFSWTECCKPTQGKFMKEKKQKKREAKEVLSKKLSFYLSQKDTLITFSCSPFMGAAQYW